MSTHNKNTGHGTGRTCITLRLLGMLLLTAWAGLGHAATSQERFLERVDAYRSDQGIEVVVGLSRPFRYVGHTLGPRGEVLRIRLLAVDQVPLSPGDDGGLSQLRWTGSGAVPLDEVLTTVSGNVPELIVRFDRRVSVRSVRVDPDSRTVSVRIEPVAAEPAAGPAAVQPAPPVDVEAVGPRIYVVNLASARGPQDLAAMRQRFAVPGRRLYESAGVTEGQRLYRVRQGFFDDLAEARRVAAGHTDAWVSEVSALERDLVVSGRERIDLTTVMVESATDKTLPPISLQRLSELMEEARRAVAEGKPTRAIVIYRRIAAYPVSPYQQDAQELLGVAHEKAGQLALAKSAYQSYLARYPDAPGSARVKQRLAGLITAAVRPGTRIRPELAAAEEAVRWDVFGSIGQNYRRDMSRTNSEKLETDQSLLSTQLDIQARRRTDDDNISLRLTGSYDHDFVEGGDHQLRLASAYVDYASSDSQHQVRVGRQTRSTGGVLGRFDGGRYGYKLSDSFRLNLVGGAPVLMTYDGFNGHQRFAGVSLDMGPLADDWNFSTFAIQQDVDGLVDRQAVGAEVRYFSPGRTLFGLVDYDVHFDALNILYAVGSWSLNDKTSLNLVADYRLSPLLSTSNALQGQTLTTVESLQTLYSSQEIMQLARDRTAISRNLTAGATHILDSHWQITGDITVTSLSGTPASGGVEATPATGPDYFYNLQFIGTDLVKNGDLGILGLRYSDTTTSSTITTTLSARYPLDSRWRINPRLRVDYRTNDGGGNQWTLAPAVRGVYAWKRMLSFEVEAGAEVLELDENGVRDLTEIYFFYLGYRYDF